MNNCVFLSVFSCVLTNSSVHRTLYVTVAMCAIRGRWKSCGQLFQLQMRRYKTKIFGAVAVWEYDSSSTCNCIL